jgi:hypothetical protein
VEENTRMSIAEPKKTRRIFVIGPMTVSGNISSNIIDIKAALDTILLSLSDGYCTVTIPQEQYGNDIPTDVFNAIDLSDLVVADISARSPSVIYELAFAHALGIPTLLIDDEANYRDGRDITAKPVFYLRGARTLRIDSRSRAALHNVLRPFIASWMEKANTQYNDPLTKFYEGISLVDVSAVAGIAAGYAENFVVPVMNAIKDRGNTFLQSEAPPVAIVVVVPESIDQVDRFQYVVMEKLEKDFPGKVIFPLKLIVSQDRKEARTVIYVQRIVIDVPRTVFPLRRSKRVDRLRQSGREHEAEEMEQKLLARFMSTLEKMAKRHDQIVSEQLLVKRLDELTDTLNAISK